MRLLSLKLTQEMRCLQRFRGKVVIFSCLDGSNIPGGSDSKESAHNAGDLGSIPGLGRFPWRRERLPTLVFWPEEFHGLYSPWGRKELDTTQQLSLSQSSEGINLANTLTSNSLSIKWILSLNALLIQLAKDKNLLLHGTVRGGNFEYIIVNFNAN